MLVCLNKGTTSMLVPPTNPQGIELYSYANAFFCFIWKTLSSITWVKHCTVYFQAVSCNIRLYGLLATKFSCFGHESLSNLPLFFFLDCTASYQHANKPQRDLDWLPRLRENHFIYDTCKCGEQNERWNGTTHRENATADVCRKENQYF